MVGRKQMIFIKDDFKRQIEKILIDYLNENENIIEDLLSGVENHSIEDRDMEFGIRLKDNFINFIKNQDVYIIACNEFQEYSNKREALKNELLQFIKKQTNFIAAVQFTEKVFGKIVSSSKSDYIFGIEELTDESLAKIKNITSSFEPVFYTTIAQEDGTIDSIVFSILKLNCRLDVDNLAESFEDIIYSVCMGASAELLENNGLLSGERNYYSSYIKLKEYAEKLVDDNIFARLTNNNQRVYYILDKFGNELEVDPSKIIDVVNMLKTKNQDCQTTR